MSEFPSCFLFKSLESIDDMIICSLGVIFEQFECGGVVSSSRFSVEVAGVALAEFSAEAVGVAVHAEHASFAGAPLQAVSAGVFGQVRLGQFGLYINWGDARDPEGSAAHGFLALRPRLRPDVSEGLGLPQTPDARRPPLGGAPGLRHVQAAQVQFRRGLCARATSEFRLDASRGNRRHRRQQSLFAHIDLGLHSGLPPDLMVRSTGGLESLAPSHRAHHPRVPPLLLLALARTKMDQLLRRSRQIGRLRHVPHQIRYAHARQDRPPTRPPLLAPAAKGWGTRSRQQYSLPPAPTAPQCRQ